MVDTLTSRLHENSHISSKSYDGLFDASIGGYYAAEMAAKKVESPQKAKKLHSVAVRLDDATLEELRALAEKERRPLANLMALLIHEGLDRRRQDNS